MYKYISREIGCTNRTRVMRAGWYRILGGFGRGVNCICGDTLVRLWKESWNMFTKTVLHSYSYDQAQKRERNIKGRLKHVRC